MRDVLLPVLFVLAAFCFVQSAKGQDLPTALPPGYAEVYKECHGQGKACVLWVGMRGRPIPGAVGLECSAFPATSGPAVVVGIPDGDGFARRTLPASVSDAEIMAACRPAARASAGPRCQRCGPNCPCGPGCACDQADAEARRRAAEPPPASYYYGPPPAQYFAPPPAQYFYAPPSATYYYPPAPGLGWGAGLQLGPFGASAGGCVGGR